MNQLSNSASSLVASIIVLTMVEMILPEGKIRKYVTFVATMILSIVVLQPLISFLNNDINIGEVFEIEKSSFAKNEYIAKMEYAKNKSIDEMYENSLKSDIVTRLEQNGYKVKIIDCTIDEETYEPKKIELQLEHNDGDIQNVVIDVSNNTVEEMSFFEIAKVKNILHETYNIDEKNIIVNEIQ